MEKNDFENETFAKFDDLRDHFGKSYEKVIFDQWSKLYFSLDTKPEIQILNELYYWSECVVPTTADTPLWKWV